MSRGGSILLSDIVVEAGLLAQLFPYDSNFLLEIFDDALLVAVEPTG